MAINHFRNPKFYRNAEGGVYESYNGEPWQVGDTVITKKEYETGQKEDAKRFLLTILKPGSKVYTKTNHVSSSGMSRCISLYAVRDGEITKLDWHVAKATGNKIDNKHGGIKVSGCGMDMGFHLVYNLGRALWPNGTPEPHGTRNGEPDSDGGYALKHQWL